MKDWLATIVRGIIGCFALSIILEDMIKAHRAHQNAKNARAAEKRLRDAC